MAENIRLPFDRRTGRDRRKTQQLNYFLKGGLERRKGREQRSGEERRDQWAKINKWSSIWAEMYDPEEFPDD